MRGPFVDPPVPEMAVQYEAGATLDLLARWYDVSKSTVRNRLKAAGVQMRRRGAPNGNQHARKEEER